jgi:outer membrane protein OmpA-like peptidoglycan-associated protein
MKQSLKAIATCTALLCTFCVGLAHGVSNSDSVKVKGLITSRDGEKLTLKSNAGSTVIVELTDDTKVVSPKGLLKIRRSEQSVTALIPGLRIEVQGTGDESRVVATNIKFEKDDLRLAETIQAGLTPTQEQASENKQNIATHKTQIESNQKNITSNQGQIAENQQDIENTTKRFSQLTEYDKKASASVYFEPSSSTISAKDRTVLTQLAASAINLNGYIIQVKGYADSSGNAVMNENLSMDRAQAVVAYLLQNCSIPLRHIVAPGAMGEADPAAPNESASGRAENRRVELTVMVNRGLSASTQAQ